MQQLQLPQLLLAAAAAVKSAAVEIKREHALSLMSTER
jgi:hypothetical protein